MKTDLTHQPSGVHPQTSSSSRVNFALVIPTRNAASFAPRQIEAIRGQTLRPSRVIIIDSESTDGSPEIFRVAGHEVITIPRYMFDHGGTRNLGMNLATEAEFLVYMTQDAIPHGRHALESLLFRFEDPLVGIAYGRQLPREDAGAIERHARLFNYGPLSKKHNLTGARGLGIKSVFTSNSFAGYRRTALASVGGFPAKTIASEDHVAAGRMLLDGWSIAYAGDAEVVHSHNYTFSEECKRYFDIGVTHQHNPFLLDTFGNATSEGRKFVRSEFLYLVKYAPLRIPEAFARTILKSIGYNLGRREEFLPHFLKYRFARHKDFFKSHRQSITGTMPGTPGMGEYGHDKAQ